MIDNNKEVRKRMKEKHVTQWMLGDYFGVHETTVIRNMRHELSDADKARYIKAIEEIAEEMKANAK